MTDSNGLKVETTEYIPFGGRRDHTGSEVSNYKYTDQELDPETGLYNYNARLYDPIIGRFITADSIVQAPYDPQTLNRYSYCRNNPLIYVDPSGHGFFSWLKRQWKRFRKWNKKENRFDRWLKRNNISVNASVNVTYRTNIGSGVPDYGRRNNSGSWDYNISSAVAYSKSSSNRQIMLANTMNIVADPSYWAEYRKEYVYGYIVLFDGAQYIPLKIDVFGLIKIKISHFFDRSGTSLLANVNFNPPFAERMTYAEYMLKNNPGLSQLESLVDLPLYHPAKWHEGAMWIGIYVPSKLTSVFIGFPKEVRFTDPFFTGH